MFAMPTAAKALVQRVVLSMVTAAFAFLFFLYTFCDQFRPRVPTPELGFDHPFSVKGRLIYISSFESLFLNGFFVWIAVLFIVIFVLQSTVGRVLQYDVLQGKIVRAPLGSRTNWRQIAILAAAWLALLVAGWRASL